MFCVKWKRATVGNEKVGENQIYEELTDRRAAADAAEDKVLVPHLEMDFAGFAFFLFWTFGFNLTDEISQIHQTHAF